MLKDFFHYQAMFQTYLGLRMYAAYVFFALATFAEGVGILMLLPIMQKIDSGIKQTSSTNEHFGIVEETIFAIIEASGFEYGLQSVLLFVTVAFIFKGCLNFAALAYNANVNAMFLEEIRRRLSKSYLRMSFSYYTDKDVGYFTNLMNEQARKAVFANECMASFGATFVNFSILIAFAFVTTWKFGLTVLVIGFIIVVLFLRLNVFVQDLSRQSSKQEASLTKWMLEALQAFKYLTSTGKTEVLGEKIEEINVNVSSFHLKHRVASAFTVSLREPVAVICIVVMLLIQAFVFDERLGPLFVSILLFYRGLNALFGCQASWIAMLGNIGSFEAVDNELKEQKLREEPTLGKTYSPKKTQITFENVTVQYSARDTPALQNLSFDVPENSTIAFVGKSGAGKTSIIDLIALLICPSAGLIRLDGIDASYVDQQSWRSQLGYVPQDPVLFDDTISNNITLWTKTDNAIDFLNQIKIAAKKAQILDFIEKLPNGFETKIGNNGVRLSGGQRQRLAIARELFKKPKLLLLDEATSSLDSESEQAIQKTLLNLRGQVTMILVAHRLSTIQNVDKIYVMESGTIVEQGEFNELKGNPTSKFNKMIQLQRI